MGVPKDLKYAATHEWFRIEGNRVTIGITQHAADALTDITFVQLPPVGKEIKAGAPFGEVESVKATSDLYSALGGRVVEVNQRLADEPGLVNSDPYGAGWMIQIEAGDLSGAARLMDAASYEKTAS